VSAIGAPSEVELRTGCKSSCTGRTQLTAQRRTYPGAGKMAVVDVVANPITLSVATQAFWTADLVPEATIREKR
jgi:hypothetical protein